MNMIRSPLFISSRNSTSNSTNTTPLSTIRQPQQLNSITSQKSESDIELMRTILGEHVPQSVILTCLNACAFDVSAALNWYFMEVAHQTQNGPISSTTSTIQSNGSNIKSTDTIRPFIQSGLNLTLHSRMYDGMISKTETSHYATITRGEEYNIVTKSNEKYVCLKLRKRQWHGASTISANGYSPRIGFGNGLGRGQDVLNASNQTFMNGDIVTLECNGLWLRASGLNKTLQWKSPSEDSRNKFVIRGLPLGRYLQPGDYFFLTSYKWKDKEVVLREERPVGLGSYNTSMHHAFLALERIKTPLQRFYLYAKLTETALNCLPQATDTFDMKQLRIIVDGTPIQRTSRDSNHTITEEIQLTDAKIDQMVAFIGDSVDRNTLATILDGAGGNVQVALEHYFMTKSKSISEAPKSKEKHDIPNDLRQTQIGETLEMEEKMEYKPVKNDKEIVTQLPHHQRPQSELLVPIPGIKEPPISAPATSTEVLVDDLEPKELRKIPSCISEEIDANAAIESFHEPQPEEHESLTIQDFEMLSVLGKGSFGAVMLVRFKKDGRVFAIKILKKSGMDSADIVNAMEERNILQRIRHPYICGLIFAFQTNERLYLGMKYYAAGDLFYHLNLRGKLNPRDAQLYGAELVLAISYLHDLNILYRDLKPSNIMIDDEGHIGVVDFGLSKQHIYGASHGVKTLSGTAEYVAPEALAQTADGCRSYGKAYDWWSLGIVIYEMLVGESPFYDENEHTMLTRIAYSDVVFPDGFPRDALNLVRGLLAKDPSKRFGSPSTGGVERIKKDVFFQSIDWDKLALRQVPAYWKPDLTSDIDTRYVDPEFIDEGPPSAAYDPSAQIDTSISKRFSQFSFNYNLQQS